MLTSFTNIASAEELAAYLDVPYGTLIEVISLAPSYRYTSFEIPKKRGGTRRILAPCKRLKGIQRALATALYGVYDPPLPAHGFVRGRSIVTNAQLHAGKRYVFNVDLAGFFDSIGFARVKGLFMARPFSFDGELANILARICCFENALPQGAPTSPIVANMIARRLDGELQRLAGRCLCTYTRYADDISFSFSCKWGRLPEDIVGFSEDGEPRVGSKLAQLIQANDFTINEDKVHLAWQSARMTVTGLTVNEKPNVSRQFVRQIGSILNAWRKYGYAATQATFNKKYDRRHRSSGGPKALAEVLRGKLVFLKSVKGDGDPVFIKLARQYNALVKDDGPHVRMRDAVGSLWIIESEDADPNRVNPPQGSGFWLEDVGLVTCAHCVVGSDGLPLPDIVAFKADDISRRFPVSVIAASWERDIAICRLRRDEAGRYPVIDAVVRLSKTPVTIGSHVTMLGFPDYWPGATHTTALATVTGFFPRFGVEFFRIDSAIAKGNSGGPLVDPSGNVVGMAVLGEKDDGDPINGAMRRQSIEQYVASELH